MNSKGIKKAEIILSRAVNQIQIIKKGLSTNHANFHLYNDFLIIGEIVPKLPSNVLAELLLQLRMINE
jgi:hypothetical protein